MLVVGSMVSSHSQPLVQQMLVPYMSTVTRYDCIFSYMATWGNDTYLVMAVGYHLINDT